ncbi:MAG TPA: MOSC and FAD-binding oxidoreductase domain-containing protein [Candidatus Methylacidiphilales bacterium]|nr:MOSC and FAD-binding oxidoreductase domain-containing protein [Candidatus Methylacidiphilales bacterium]
MASKLLAVNVGLPREITWHGQTVRTSVWKTPVQGKRMVRRLNIDGDGQGDLAGHGGEHRAVFVYQIDSYRYWQNQLHRSDFTFGQFGENFTVEGLADTEVCIGDRYQIGGALFEVTQPRVTCYRVGIRMDEPRMAALLVSHGRPGFYFRVLREGEVEAGDEILKVRDGPERLSVADVNALLYLPGHDRARLEQALSIPALSAGWRSSFQAMLQKETNGGAVTGNPGLTSAGGPPPAWPGFRGLRVSRMTRESENVVSLELVSADDHPLAVALPGQFVVLRLRPQPNGPSLLRSYSLSGAPNAECYRLGVKQESKGAASNYIATGLRVGDLLEVSAPRGSFVLHPGTRPVILISAGIGVTPVLSMLHALAAEASTRIVWWLRGVRNRGENPFADEARVLLNKLPNSRSHVRFSKPLPTDQPGMHFDAPGRIEISTLEQLDISREADFYLCGPGQFLRDFAAGLIGWGVPRERVYTEIFGPGESGTPGIAPKAAITPHPPANGPDQGLRISFARSGLDVFWDSRFKSLLELAEACDVPVRWSCRTGVCHNCETALIAGAVDYDPNPIESPADGNLLTCCSRPRTDLIIDL